MQSLVPQTIQYGDWIIIYSNRTQVTSDIVTRDKEVQSRYGHFKHNEMVGKPWGIKFSSSNGRGFVYLLKPTPELWTLALPHRTQILYLPDIAFITSYLNILPGSSVIEAGTGSGSFSHSLVRTVGTTGQVHSFEYHEERFQKAKDEFALHRISDIIRIKHQNVYRDGFDGLDNEVDAVFLDLPAPWDALEHAKKAMRKDRPSRICCFSPCIEQVIRTCTSLSDLGFSDVTMFETLTRTHDPVAVVPTLKPISTAIDRIQQVEARKGKRRDLQILEAKRKREEKQVSTTTSSLLAGREDEDEEEEGLPEKKRKLEGQTEFRDEEGVEGDEPGRGGGGEEEDGNESIGVNSVSGSTTTTRPTTPQAAQPLTTTTATSGGPKRVEKEYVLKPSPYVRGHTSYLTFAVLLPIVTSKVKEETADEKLHDLEGSVKAEIVVESA